MLIEYTCPNCEKTHFLDVQVGGEFVQCADDEAKTQFIIEHALLKQVLPEAFVLENL